MANATAIVPAALSYYDDGYAVYRQMESTAQTFYPSEMVGLDSSGYATSCDDTTNVLFDGLFGASPALKQDTGAAGFGPLGMGLFVKRPLSFSMKTNWTAALTDVGRAVYAKFNNQVDILPNTNGNFVGIIRRFISTAEVEITPPWALAAGSEYGNVVTPAALAASQNNYNPAGLFAARELQLTNSGAATTITGLQAGTNGKRLRLINFAGGAFAITLSYLSGSSSAGNKFVATGAANATINQFGAAELVYLSAANGGVGAWQVISTN
jgi:hypothetical protein